ncbi:MULTISPECIES: bifunctional 4-hydroxy-2-oxoglutarate aldolase/2-dehydro-3-deoxy-phosphogluconate aldolase [Reichenbachiella]|uniref:bifunctional 4-hydroxy-2-oxoglutarate aldolase/2-dehydro-3-deoxy-phosphogluconate aldolase n=1 Tax=Reichenbachiella TaxID=156993 RepID=UPI000E6D17A5|nr:MULTISPECIES: bifunctional 4-hydroxy-2-oxoglutarate aldolase/2-dehydro-3-deoxy-phosphogluconate aldolase [Reichenbachiella]MBU2912756.1 bifunctional 4-hydroxy-2-oxoglutarate aldolase/2-dehydro-3-deoxy-phosphogluconate aldolase [Reichenbachiella agariperforans]RJE72428.1 2-dehydro-3-deoxyphosphogluconate aldolase [Reichenbachiella sp. MSK19-1]
MLINKFSWSDFEQAPIVGIVRGMSLDQVRMIARAYEKAGLYALEVTMNTDRATGIIATIAEEFPTLCIGAGTVCSSDDLQKALDAGAQFVVTPVVNEEVITASVAVQVPIFSGAYTPSEIYHAWSLGASVVKVFPATQLGTQYIKDVLAPLNQIKLLPTGGVTLDNIRSFFEAGAVGVGMGSSLLDKTHIQAQDEEALINHFSQIRGSVNLTL